MRVAALADVHGNAHALVAVLAEVEQAGVDLIVFCGDLTWGPLPNETLASCVRSRPRCGSCAATPTARSVSTRPAAVPGWPRSTTRAATEFVQGFDAFVVVDVDGLGPTRFVHGSPRSDEECVTPRDARRAVARVHGGVPERVVVTAHVHVSYDRQVADVHLVGPGSVGRPYEGRPGHAGRSSVPTSSFAAPTTTTRRRRRRIARRASPTSRATCATCSSRSRARSSSPTRKNGCSRVRLRMTLSARPTTRYAKSGDVNIAYQVVGDGPFDLVFVPAAISHVDLIWDDPERAAFFNRLASFSRLIVSRQAGHRRLRSGPRCGDLETRIDDVRAVLDAVGSPRAAVDGGLRGRPDEPSLRGVQSEPRGRGRRLTHPCRGSPGRRTFPGASTLDEWNRAARSRGARVGGRSKPLARSGRTRPTRRPRLSATHSAPVRQPRPPYRRIERDEPVDRRPRHPPVGHRADARAPPRPTTVSRSPAAAGWPSRFPAPRSSSCPGNEHIAFTAVTGVQSPTPSRRS